MQCRLIAMHVGLHGVNAMVVNCAGGNGQLPTSVQPLLRLLDTCLLHTRQVLHTLLHIQESAYAAVSTVTQLLWFSVVITVCMFPRTLPYHRHTALLQSMSACKQAACVYYTASNSCSVALEAQALSFQCHVEASLNVKLGMSSEQPTHCKPRCKHVLTRCFMVLQASMC